MRDGIDFSFTAAAGARLQFAAVQAGKDIIFQFYSNRDEDATPQLQALIDIASTSLVDGLCNEIGALIMEKPEWEKEEKEEPQSRRELNVASNKNAFQQGGEDSESQSQPSSVVVQQALAAAAAAGLDVSASDVIELDGDSVDLAALEASARDLNSVNKLPWSEAQLMQNWRADAADTELSAPASTTSTVLDKSSDTEKAISTALHPSTYPTNDEINVDADVDVAVAVAANVDVDSDEYVDAEYCDEDDVYYDDDDDDESCDDEDELEGERPNPMRPETEGALTTKDTKNKDAAETAAAVGDRDGKKSATAADVDLNGSGMYGPQRLFSLPLSSIVEKGSGDAQDGSKRSNGDGRFVKDGEIDFDAAKNAVVKALHSATAKTFGSSGAGLSSAETDDGVVFSFNIEEPKQELVLRVNRVVFMNGVGRRKTQQVKDCTASVEVVSYFQGISDESARNYDAVLLALADDTPTFSTDIKERLSNPADLAAAKGFRLIARARVNIQSKIVQELHLMKLGASSELDLGYNTNTEQADPSDSINAGSRSEGSKSGGIDLNASPGGSVPSATASVDEEQLLNHQQQVSSSRSAQPQQSRATPTERYQREGRGALLIQEPAATTSWGASPLQSLELAPTLDEQKQHNNGQTNADVVGDDDDDDENDDIFPGGEDSEKWETVEEVAMRELRTLLAKNRGTGFAGFLQDVASGNSQFPLSAADSATPESDTTTGSSTGPGVNGDATDSKTNVQDLFDKGKRETARVLQDILSRPTVDGATESVEELLKPTPTVPIVMPKDSAFARGETIDIFQSPAELYGEDQQGRSDIPASSTLGQAAGVGVGAGAFAGQSKSGSVPNRERMEAVAVPPDPDSLPLEQQRLALLLTELNRTDFELHDTILEANRDLLLSDNFLYLMQNANQTVTSFPDRFMYKRLVDKSIELHAELGLLIRRESTRHLETIEEVCDIAARFQHDDVKFLERMDYLKPRFDTNLLTYLTFAVKEEEGRLRRLGKDPRKFPSEWLQILKIVEQGVETELKQRYSHMLDNLVHVVHSFDRNDTRALAFSVLVEMTAPMDLPYLKALTMNMIEGITAQYNYQQSSNKRHSRQPQESQGSATGLIATTAPGGGVGATATTTASEHVGTDAGWDAAVDAVRSRTDQQKMQSQQPISDYLMTQLIGLQGDVEQYLSDEFIREQIAAFREQVSAQGKDIAMRYRNPLMQNEVETMLQLEREADVAASSRSNSYSNSNSNSNNRWSNPSGQ